MGTSSVPARCALVVGFRPSLKPKYTSAIKAPGVGSDGRESFCSLKLAPTQNWEVAMMSGTSVGDGPEDKDGFYLFSFKRG